MNTSIAIHIRTLFKQVQPEWLIREMLSHSVPCSAEYSSRICSDLGATYLSSRNYLRAARSLTQNARRTDDELLALYKEVSKYLSQKPRGGIFLLLAQYAHEVLECHGVYPLCRQEYILDWRDLSLDLGQDLLTCAALAHEDICQHRERMDFSWPVAIHTDHHMLHKVLLRGVSENHFHLNGSTQIFSLAWAFLMNHPEKSRAYFSDVMFSENLKPTASYGTVDNKKEWAELIQVAAWIRAYLFYWFARRRDKEDLRPCFAFKSFYNSMCREGELELLIEPLRYEAARFQYKYVGKACIDYTITHSVKRANPGENRLLAGERYFLNRCFRKCFVGRFSYYEMNLFYLYLLIKLQFRAELIQTNGRAGFQNFSNYQDRKAHLWAMRPEYLEEAYRLSIGAILKEGECNKPYIQSLEMRIMPRVSSRALEDVIWETDSYASASLHNDVSQSQRQRILGQKQKHIRSKYDRIVSDCDQDRYYYVLHFAKRALEEVPIDVRKGNLLHTRFNLQPRNYAVRKRVEQQAKAIAKLFDRSVSARERIRAIDACSNEIGCRPETFATAFRFLRNRSIYSMERSESSKAKLDAVRYSDAAKMRPILRATYHVGEDYLDITDGLRAIDEAICFLNLRRGDRLGHALALGTQPEQFYRIKDYVVYLPKQDLLDNLVWVLYRSLEWNISIPLELRNILKERAETLMYEIYGNGYIGGDTWRAELQLADYYRSWKLRGDDPSVYAEAMMNPMTDIITRIKRDVRGISGEYERAKLDDRLWECATSSIDITSILQYGLFENGRSDMLMVRKQQRIQMLLYKYHFGLKERERGQEIISYSVTKPYVQVIKAIQEYMMERIMQNGIAIECNPSSNKLIGTFDKYEQHPIFRFNHYNLKLPEHDQNQTQLCVSINTDDLGVFDTSLENEYALIYGCLQKRFDENGKRLISDDAILEYLNHLRMLGNDMAFTRTMNNNIT